MLSHVAIHYIHAHVCGLNCDSVMREDIFILLLLTS